MVLAKTPGGKRFGGYADLAWTSSDGYIRSDKTFLFRCSGPGRDRADVENPEYALLHHPADGPFFGPGDLAIHVYEGHYAQANNYAQFPGGTNIAGGNAGQDTHFDLAEWEVLRVEMED